MKTKPMTPTAGLSLCGLPTLDALFISGRHLGPSHVCTELCQDIFHTDPQDQKAWDDLEPIAGRLYRRYGHRYEQTHLGQFMAVVPTGTVVTAPNLLDVVIQAIQSCPDEAYVKIGFFIFRVGQRAVGVTSRRRARGTGQEAMKKAQDIDWTTIEFILCTREKLLPTNKQAQCAGCGITVYYNIAVPPAVPKMCETCAVRYAQRSKRKN